MVFLRHSNQSINRFPLQSRLCDRNDKSLVIDSAVAYTYKSKVKVLLFYGDKVSESEPMDSNAINGSIFAVKSLKELHSSLKGPIHTAYEDSIFLLLHNVEPTGSQIVWQLYENFTLVVHKQLFNLSRSIDCFHLSSSLVCLKNDNGFYLFYHLNETIGRFAKQTVGTETQIKLIQDSKSTSSGSSKDFFDGKLNGIAITAAMNRIISGKEYVYMFAGRNLCRQEISTKWIPMCDIEDIADWIYCSKDIDNNKTLLILVIVLVIIVIVSIIILVVYLSIKYLFNAKANSKSNENLSNESSVLRKIKSNMKSKDIIEPKPLS